MRRLSSPYTFFYKRMLPVIWVVGISAVVAVHWLAPPGGRPDPVILLMLPLMFGVGFFVFRKLIADLLDEAWLDGDELVLRNRGEQARVALREVVNINSSGMNNPRRITVLLRTDSRFGRSISFVSASPRRFLSAFKPDPIAAELIERVDALRATTR